MKTRLFVAIILLTIFISVSGCIGNQGCASVSVVGGNGDARTVTTCTNNGFGK